MESEGVWCCSGCCVSVLRQHLRGTPPGPYPAVPCSSLALPRDDPCFSGWLFVLGPGLISFPTLPPALGWKEDGQVALDAECQQDHDSG